MIARDLDYLNPQQAESMLDEALQLSRMLYRLHQSQVTG
jgi:hypothetical protein